MMNKSYSELIRFHTFEERFRYLQLRGTVGADTFGFARYLNQKLYHSYEWRKFKREIIVRDCGCDLGIKDRVISDNIYVHHINPIDEEDIIQLNMEALLNPENAICTSLTTHNAIHYGDENLLIKEPVERHPNDTCPWKKFKGGYIKWLRKMQIQM